jgi:pre-60S factor REI1
MADTYTCMTCRMFFDSAEVQRSHYRAPWHCFNLKRKVAGLPPVSEESFEDKVKALKSEKIALDTQALQAKQRPASKKTHKFQVTKGKGRNAAGNLAMAATELGITLEDTPVETMEGVDSEEESEPELTEEEMIEQRLKNARPVPITECLFDGHESSDLQENLDYTRSKYSFFIPEIENLTDLEGLVTYLGEKVGIGYTCLYCGKDYQSLQSVRGHMVDKSHCKLKFYEELDEYEEYYNFGEEDDEEDVDGENKHRSLITVNDDGSVDTGITLSETGAELILQNGRSIGNRAYKMYYKQRHRPSESRTSVLTVQLVKQYSELGVLREKRADEIIARKKQERRIRHNNGEQVKIQLKANRLQKYMHHKECMT